MTDAELLRQIAEQDRIENVAADRAPTFKDLDPAKTATEAQPLYEGPAGLPRATSSMALLALENADSFTNQHQGG